MCLLTLTLSSKASWEGFHTVEDYLNPDCNTSYPNITVTFDLTAEFLKLAGIYEAELLFTSISPPLYAPIIGKGDLLLYMDRPHLHVVIKGSHDDRTDGINGASAEIQQLEFNDLSFHAMGLKVCGYEIPWDDTDLKPAFDIIWALTSTE